MLAKSLICTFTALATLGGVQQASAEVGTTLWGIYSNNVMFSPKPVENAYLELEYYGQKGPFDLYGYFDAPKYFGGNDNIQGVWDKDSSKLFMEHEPKLSFNRLTGKDLSIGPFKDWFIAADWILDAGNTVTSRQNTLYYGVGTTIDTHSKLTVNVNVYAKQQWENYGAANAYTSDDGGRLQVQFFYPIMTLNNGASINYFSFSNYDFGSDLSSKTDAISTYKNTRTDEAFVSTHIFSYNMKHLRAYAAGRYFHNGGQFKNGATNNWGTEFNQKSNGWAYYLGLGYQF
ncbi:nucleoside-specific channel-forming protein Tsx [Acinetobacter qingfengensis]|uniref:Nucleoside-specific channel-forming protein Tsx n=1 Tax=Acinetobacter qingfengensis TaxID=1262585 RepID=A0A1E7REN3_9GAMM|nr:nucleoside-specific channel-forming protein Tsx [Acinetobacter qingfengensis]KAA8734769.1 nucleoside-specific channel-forming protein Tsx [Acinetobacter qingfengensis]OEY97687.1 nucleoside-specific channel-forming protein Tsx [Acinetobacter qingfengensis]